MSACLAALLAGPAGLCLAAEPVEAITVPSKDVTLAFVMPGRIVEVLVEQGQQVRTGEVLARQDDTAERASLAQLKAQAEDTVRIRAAAAQRDQKKVDLDRLQTLFKKQLATQFEVDSSALDVTIAELSLELAKFQQSQDQKKYEEANAQVERMRLRSPFDGVVERVLAHEGQSTDGTRTVVLRVVRIDPLWIDASVPLAQSASLKSGDTAQVSFLGEATPVKGRIIHVAAVADSASDTLTVRVELPNPSQRHAGDRVRVDFPAADSKAGTADGSPTTTAPAKE